MKNQKVRSFAIVMVAVMLLATTAISMSTTQNAFAGKYGKNQATSQANACGNGQVPTNVGCQNTGSQIQGDENSVALAAQQTFPETDVGPTPPPPPPPEPLTCEECFTEFLTAAEIDLVELAVQATIAELCAVLEELAITNPQVVIDFFADLEAFLVGQGVDATVAAELIACLNEAIFGDD